MKLADFPAKDWFVTTLSSVVTIGSVIAMASGIVRGLFLLYIRQFYYDSNFA